MNIYDGVWVFGEEFGFPICTFSVILDSRLNFGRVPSSRSQTCFLYPLSYRLFPHSFFPIFFILIPSVRLLCFPLCFLSPFRFLLSFFPFRHLLCLSYAINLFWSDRGNQQPAMSRMVRHDLSRKKSSGRYYILRRQKRLRQCPREALRLPHVAPLARSFFDTIAFSAVSALSACCCFFFKP